ILGLEEFEQTGSVVAEIELQAAFDQARDEGLQRAKDREVRLEVELEGKWRQLVIEQRDVAMAEQQFEDVGGVKNREGQAALIFIAEPSHEARRKAAAGPGLAGVFSSQIGHFAAERAQFAQAFCWPEQRAAAEQQRRAKTMIDDIA